MKKSEKYLLFLSISYFLTLFLGLHSLNRLWGLWKGKLFFDYFGRNSIEHLMSGFCIPSVLLFLSYFFWIIIVTFGGIFTFFLYKIIRKLIPREDKLKNLIPSEIKRINKKCERRLLFFYSVGYGIFEIWFQFFRGYNEGSILQVMMSLVGIFILWFFILKIRLYD